PRRRRDDRDRQGRGAGDAPRLRLDLDRQAQVLDVDHAVGRVAGARVGEGELAGHGERRWHVGRGGGKRGRTGTPGAPAGVMRRRRRGDWRPPVDAPLQLTQLEYTDPAGSRDVWRVSMSSAAPAYRVDLRDDWWVPGRPPIRSSRRL